MYPCTGATTCQCILGINLLVQYAGESVSIHGTVYHGCPCASTGQQLADAIRADSVSTSWCQNMPVYHRYLFASAIICS